RAKNWTIRIALVGLALFAGVKTYQAYQEYGFCQIACESSVTAEGKPKPYAFFANDGEEGGWDVTQCEPSFAASFASRNSRLDSVVHSYVEILTHDQTEMSDMAKKDDREYGIVHLDPSVLKRSRQVLDHCEEAFQFKEELKARVHTVDFLVVDLLDRCHDYRLDRSRFIGDFFGTVRGAKVLFDLPTAEAEQAFASLDKKERFEVASYLERLPWAAADDPSGKLKGESRSLDPGAFDKETVAGDGGSDADTKKGTSAVGQEIPNAKTGEETLAGKKGKTGEEDKAGIDRKKLKGEEGDDLQSKKGTTPEVEEIVKALEGEQSLDGMIGKTGKENTPGGTEETKERLASEGKEVIPIHIYFVDIKEERARTSPLLDEKARVKEEMRRTSALLERVKKSLKAPKPAQISAILAAQYLEWLEHNFPGETFTWGLKARLLASPYAFLLPLEERIQWQREVAEGGREFEMSDINCDFDMPQSVPLRDFNTKCYGEDFEGQLLGLRGRFESEEVTGKFIEALLNLTPADQKKVLIRFTDRAMGKLYAHAQSYPKGSAERNVLTLLFNMFEAPEKRIVAEGRELVISQQTQKGIPEERREWGINPQTMLAEAFMLQQCDSSAAWCYT
ncbi:MAG: hypothetical protein NT099_10130, partial [Candidatus Saganbacteria bacterium]|nr:hypothetical protein [Candidatus Saganbacteria bacterium]